MMTYKGYYATVSFDDEAEIFHGEVVGLKDVITFQGQSVEELKVALEDSVEDYLEFCASRGEEADKPYSGKFMLRVEPALHRRLSALSAEEGTSLNNWIRSKLEVLTQ